MCHINLPNNYLPDNRHIEIYSPLDKKRIPSLDMLRDTKKCVKCGKVKHKDEFYTGTSLICKDCKIENQKKLYKKNTSKQ